MGGGGIKFVVWGGALCGGAGEVGTVTLAALSRLILLESSRERESDVADAGDLSLSRKLFLSNDE